jgi:hypothetical protein
MPFRTSADAEEVRNTMLKHLIARKNPRPFNLV